MQLSTNNTDSKTIFRKVNLLSKAHLLEIFETGKIIHSKISNVAADKSPTMILLSNLSIHR